MATEMRSYKGLLGSLKDCALAGAAYVAVCVAAVLGFGCAGSDITQKPQLNVLQDAQPITAIGFRKDNFSGIVSSNFDGNLEAKVKVYDESPGLIRYDRFSFRGSNSIEEVIEDGSSFERQSDNFDVFGSLQMTSGNTISFVGFDVNYEGERLDSTETNNYSDLEISGVEVSANLITENGHRVKAGYGFSDVTLDVNGLSSVSKYNNGSFSYEYNGKDTSSTVTNVGIEVSHINGDSVEEETDGNVWYSRRLGEDTVMGGSIDFEGNGVVVLTHMSSKVNDITGNLREYLGSKRTTIDRMDLGSSSNTKEGLDGSTTNIYVEFGENVTCGFMREHVWNDKKCGASLGFTYTSTDEGGKPGAVIGYKRIIE